MPEFTKNFFGRNVGIWKKHLMKYAGKPNLRFLEIGSFEGQSALWLMDNILTEPLGKETSALK